LQPGLVVEQGLPAQTLEPRPTQRGSQRRQVCGEGLEGPLRLLASHGHHPGKSDVLWGALAPGAGRT
jgi:hypothetical protein